MNITVKEYTLLFNAVTNALEQLEALKSALILAQQQAEIIVIAKNSNSDSYRGDIPVRHGYALPELHGSF